MLKIAKFLKQKEKQHVCIIELLYSDKMQISRIKILDMTKVKYDFRAD